MTWDGQERRHIDVELLYEEMEKVKISHARLEEKVSGFLEGTIEYRRSLCRKLDGIVDKIDGLPCDKREGMHDNVKAQLVGMWCVISVVFFSILAVGIKTILKG
jgi:hypothetical protein